MKVNKNLITVIIPNWNGKDKIGYCLKSLRKQSFRNFKILVVDNGSIDNSVEFIKSEFPEVNVVSLDKNFGFAGGVNVGIKLSDTKYIALLNNDAIVHKEWLEKLHDTISVDSQIGICTSKIMKMSKNHHITNKFDTTGDFMSVWGIPFPRARGEKDLGQYERLEEVFSACAGSSLYRKSLFLDIGMFDEKFFAYYEDVDLSFRARLRGYKIYYEPKSIAYHEIGGTSSKLGNFTRYHTIKNIYFLYTKNMPLKTYFTHLPRFLLVCFLITAGALRHGAIFVVAKAYLSILFKLPIIIFDRIKIQRSKKVSSKYIEGLLVDTWPLKKYL